MHRERFANIVKNGVERQRILLRIQTDEESGNEEEEGEKWTFANLPHDPLVHIFHFVAQRDFHDTSEFDDFVESRTYAHFNLRRNTENHRSIAELFRLREVCRRFRDVIDAMKPNTDYQPIPIVIRIQGDKTGGRKSTLYKYGGSGNVRPAIPLKRIWQVSENIRKFETITKMIITDMFITDALIDALCDLKNRLKTLKDVHFYEMLGVWMADETKEEKLKKLVDLFAEVEYVYFEWKIEEEEEEENKKKPDPEEELWKEKVMESLTKTNGVNRVSVKKCREQVRRATYGLKRAGLKRTSNFLKRIRSFKRKRLFFILCEVIPTNTGLQQKIRNGAISEQNVKVFYRALRASVSKLSRAKRLWAKHKFNEICKSFDSGKRVRVVRIKKLIRELLEVLSEKPISRKLNAKIEAFCYGKNGGKKDFQKKRRNKKKSRVAALEEKFAVSLNVNPREDE